MQRVETSEGLGGFRAEVREFVESQLPADIRDTVRSRRLISREQAQRWQRTLSAKGWGAPSWPKRFGGTGWPLVKQAILQEELLLSGAPAIESLGLGTIGPTIIRHGTREQQERFLSRIVNFDDYWAQAYSEPGAGSDLASLKCAARRDGDDDYIVNGTKIWQSHAHWANWALVLVRTATTGRKQEGITVLLVDLTSPGVTVRPIKFINGTLFHSELFFDDVRVPAANRVGEEGAGWSIAKSLLVTERLFTGRVPECKAQLAHLKALTVHAGPGGCDLQEQPWFGRRIAELEIRLQAFEAAWWRAVERAQHGDDLGAEVMKLRLIGGALLQELFGLQLEVVGADGLRVDPASLEEDGAAAAEPLGPGYAENIHIHHFRYRGITLGTGSAEVQRDLVAREIFERGDTVDQPVAETEDEQMLRETVSRFIERDYPFARRRAIVAQPVPFDADAWKGLADLGMVGLIAPAEIGGYGGRIRDLAIVAESLGEGIPVEPYVWTAVAGVKIAGAFPEAAAAAGLSLSKMIAGEQRVALAYLERGARFDPAYCRTVARRSGAGWVLTGQKQLVWGASSSSVMIVSARLETSQGELALFCVDTTRLPPIRPGRAYNDRSTSDIAFDGLLLADDALVAGGDVASAVLHEVVDLVTLALCAEGVGAMERALKITIDYMKARQQFGRSISEFQALRHRLVEHSLALYNVRSLVRLAVTAVDQDGDGVAIRKAVSAAKWMAGKAARQIGHDVLQLHGAIGFQDETPISHYAKFLISLDAMLGDSEYHLTRYI
ncbi:acyl-CoA dehydrogenase [Afipia sp. P52-10]|nr:acyl-CoA dehydrogenase [Afipia sp. P52-10]